MGHSCCLINCKNRSENSKCFFYKFPAAKYKEVQKQRWIDAVSRINCSGGKEWVLKPHHYICNEHFIGKQKSEAELSPSYVPTIFSIKPQPKQLLKRRYSRKKELRTTNHLRRMKKLACTHKMDSVKKDELPLENIDIDIVKEEPREEVFPSYCENCNEVNSTATACSHCNSGVVGDKKTEDIDCTSTQESLHLADTKITIKEEKVTVEKENYVDSPEYFSFSTGCVKSELLPVKLEEEMVKKKLTENKACSNSETSQDTKESKKSLLGLRQLLRAKPDFRHALLKLNDESAKLLKLNRELNEIKRESMLKELEMKRELIELKKKRLELDMKFQQVKKFKCSK